MEIWSSVCKVKLYLSIYSNHQLGPSRVVPALLTMLYNNKTTMNENKEDGSWNARTQRIRTSYSIQKKKDVLLVVRPTLQSDRRSRHLPSTWRTGKQNKFSKQGHCHCSFMRSPRPRQSGCNWIWIQGTTQSVAVIKNREHETTLTPGNALYWSVD